MRTGLLAAALTALLGVGSPASAALTTITTTSSTESCGDDCSMYLGNLNSIGSFDSSLGTLIGVTLQVDATTYYNYWINFVDAPNGTSPGTTESGTAQLAAHVPLTVTVGGVDYTVNVSGTDSVSYTGAGYGTGTFQTSGSATFDLSPTIFNSFIDQSNRCSPIVPALGVCVSSTRGTVDVLGIASTDNLLFTPHNPTPGVAIFNFTLSYTYAAHPSGVPEPATWAMMLLGFGAIGVALRRKGQTLPKPVGGV